MTDSPLTRLAEILPSEEFSVVLTTSDDDSDRLAVTSRSDPSPPSRSTFR